MLLVLIILFHVMCLLIFSLCYIICYHCCYFVHYCRYFILLENEDETILAVIHVVTEVTTIFLKLSLVVIVVFSDVSDHFKPTS